MEWGNVLVVDHIENKHTREIFDEYNWSWYNCTQQGYSTLLLTDVYTVRCSGIYLRVSLYIQRIYDEDLYSHHHFISMTQLKKRMGGWSYREGQGNPLIEETIREISKYLKENTLAVNDIITLPLESDVAIEGRGSSDWQGGAWNAKMYEVVGVTYRREW